MDQTSPEQLAFDDAVIMATRYLASLAESCLPGPHQIGFIAQQTLMRTIRHLNALRLAAIQLGLTQVAEHVGRHISSIEETPLRRCFDGSFYTQLECIRENLTEECNGTRTTSSD